MLRLVEGLLDLSLMEAGQLEVRLEPVDVGELMTHTAELFALRAKDLNVRLEVLAEAVPDVSGDVDRLEQVLANLVDNALRHTPPGATWSSARGGRVRRPWASPWPTRDRGSRRRPCRTCSTATSGPTARVPGRDRLGAGDCPGARARAEG